MFQESERSERYQPWLKRSLDEEDPNPLFEDISSLDRYLTVHRTSAPATQVGCRTIECTTSIGKL
jgi:hypothetical protein